MTQAVTLQLPTWMVQAIDDLIEQGHYANRSDVVRTALRRLAT